MIFIGFLAVSILLGSLVSFDGGSLLVLVDLFTMVVIIAAPVIILLCSGIKHGNRLVFKIIFSFSFKNFYGKKLQTALHAVELLKTTTLGVGIILFIVGIINVLLNIADPSAIGPGLAYSVVSLLYSVSLAYLVYNPVYMKVKHKLNRKNRKISPYLYSRAKGTRFSK